MSLALIQESAREVRRLSVAGSRLAIGDFRVQKLIPPLEQAGASVPVFAQVAKGLKDLVNSSEADSAANLLALSTLLNAILYTQGQTTVQGAYAEVDECGVSGASTKVTARALRPIIQALTTNGAGRLETIKTALDRGMFKDLRLIQPSIRGLEDSFPEIADLVGEKVLPGYGAGIVPLLKEGFDIKGKKSDARRLLVMHRLDPISAVELCKKALDEGSADVKIAAIECLGQHEDCVPLVLEQASSKNKQVRAAALEALAPHDRPEIVTLFNNLISGNALDILARPFRFIRSRQIMNSLLKEGSSVFQALIKGDSEQIARYTEILNCLIQRQDADSELFLLNCFVQSDTLAKVKASKNSPYSGADVLYRIVLALHGTGSTKAFDAILAKRNALPSGAFHLVLQSALHQWPPAKVFDEFSPLLEDKKGNKEKAAEIQKAVFTTTKSGAETSEAAEVYSVEDEDLNPVEWDPRWLEAAIKYNHPLIVGCLARPGHKECIHYLLNLADGKQKAGPIRPSAGYAGMVISSLVRCQYPKVTDVFLDLVSKKLKGAKHIDYETTLLLRNVRFLPASELPRLDEFATKLDEKFVDDFLEALQPLREAAQNSQPT